MKAVTFARATGVAILLFASGIAAARSDDTPPDSICSVVGTAQRYVGTTVTVSLCPRGHPGGVRR